MSNNHEIHKAEKREAAAEAAASNAQAVVADLEAKRASARRGSKRSAKIERRGSVSLRASERTTSEPLEACLRPTPSVSARPLTQVAGLRKGIRKRIPHRETSRLSRRCTTANFLRAVLLGREP